MSTVAEDTNPAEAESGIRRFSVTAHDGSRISLQVIHEKEPDAPEGEVHRQGVALCREVVKNADLVKALIQLAAAAAKSPLHQTL